MRIVCPSCSAAYEVPDALLGGAAGPRKVRCAKCQQEWAPPELAPAAPAQPLQTFEPEARDMLPQIPDPPAPRFSEPRLGDAPPRSVRISARGRTPRAVDALAILVSLGVLAGLGWGVYSYRAPIMAAWPPSQRVFHLVGLAP